MIKDTFSMVCCQCFSKDKDKKLTKIQKRQCVEIMLEKDFPIVMSIMLVIFNIILALGAIGIQTLSILLKTRLYYVACG